MGRKALWLALLGVAAHWQAVYAQTLVFNPEKTPAGKKIVSTIKDLPAGAKVAYRADATGDVAKLNGHQAYWWGTGGWHDAVAVVFVEGDEEPKWLPGRYCVGDAPPPGPSPPQPVKTLAELAGKDAAVLAKIYASLLKDIADFPTVAKFRDVHADMLADLELAQNGAAAEIDKRLTVETFEQLKAALDAIVKELGGGPSPVPPPQAGKRIVYLVRETTNIDTDLARVVEDIQGGGSTESQYLASKGHRTILVDPDDVDPVGQPSAVVRKLQADLAGLALPAILIADQSSGVVVFKQSINPDTFTAGEMVELVKRSGG